MATQNLSSTSSAAPNTIYSGSARLVRIINNDAAIIVHVRDPLCSSSGKWADIAPGNDHIFVRASVTGSIFAYADSGTPSVTINEMGGR